MTPPTVSQSPSRYYRKARDLEAMIQVPPVTIGGRGWSSTKFVVVYINPLFKDFQLYLLRVGIQGSLDSNEAEVSKRCLRFENSLIMIIVCLWRQLGREVVFPLASCMPNSLTAKRCRGFSAVGLPFAGGRYDQMHCRGQAGEGPCRREDLLWFNPISDFSGGCLLWCIVASCLKKTTVGEFRIAFLVATTFSGKTWHWKIVPQPRLSKKCSRWKPSCNSSGLRPWMKSYRFWPKMLFHYFPKYLLTLHFDSIVVVHYFSLSPISGSWNHWRKVAETCPRHVCM